MIPMVVRPHPAGVNTEQLKHRPGSRFDTDWSTTVEQLRREARHLGVTREIVLCLDVVERDIRHDGWIRANANPASPMATIVFDTKRGPLQFPCDTYRDWRDNVRAIVLTLEHLRAVDRYGVSTSGEQYTGWLAIEPPKASLPDPYEIIGQIAGVNEPTVAAARTNDDVLRAMVRHAAFKAHPDHGGSNDLFAAFQNARARLRDAG